MPVPWEGRLGLSVFDIATEPPSLLVGRNPDGNADLGSERWRLTLDGWVPGDEFIRYRTTERWKEFWDVPSSGSGVPRKVDASGHDYGGSPDWTPDGHFFLQGNESALLAHPENRSFWSRGLPAPVVLAAPSPIASLRFTPDGRRIVAQVSRSGTEIVRFDVTTRESTVLLGGARAGVAEFSPDGEWVAWVSNDAGPSRLWRSRADGSAATQMTDPARVDVNNVVPVR